MTDEKAIELWPWSFSRDPKTILFGAGTGGDGNILMLPVDGGPIDYRLRTEFIESHPAVSPDGSLIAYASQRAGRGQVYIERYPGLGDRRTVSPGTGAVPVWRKDGRELYYFDAQNQQVMSVPITPGREIVIGTPKPLFKSPLFQIHGWRSFDVMPDGRFVMIAPNQTETGRSVLPIVVQNFTEELKRLVPRN